MQACTAKIRAIQAELQSSKAVMLSGSSIKFGSTWMLVVGSKIFCNSARVLLSKVKMVLEESKAKQTREGPNGQDEDSTKKATAKKLQKGVDELEAGLEQQFNLLHELQECLQHDYAGQSGDTGCSATKPPAPDMVKKPSE